MLTRRLVLGSAAAVAAAAGGWRELRPDWDSEVALPAEPQPVKRQGAMPYRRFGRTGLEVSEVGFGGWAIGGQSYGAVERGESLRALARAQDLGCNFVDTAAVYGDSESVLGKFLADRRSEWIVSSKFSGQKEGMTATLESQLRLLGTDRIDFYMVHWRPLDSEAALYEELDALKRAGKIRFAGVSLMNRYDIDAVLANDTLDGFMVALNLLKPDPFLERRGAIARAGKAVIARSTLREGFLAGNFKRDTRFTDPADQRSKWSAATIASTVDQVERFRLLSARAGSLARAAIGYPLSFPEISTAVLGVKTAWEAEENFGQAPGYRLNADELATVLSLQRELALLEPRSPLGRLIRRAKVRLSS